MKNLHPIHPDQAPTFGQTPGKGESKGGRRDAVEFCKQWKGLFLDQGDASRVLLDLDVRGAGSGRVRALRFEFTDYLEDSFSFVQEYRHPVAVVFADFRWPGELGRDFSVFTEGSAVLFFGLSLFGLVFFHLDFIMILITVTSFFLFRLA